MNIPQNIHSIIQTFANSRMNYLFSMQIRRFSAISSFFLQQFRPVAKGLPLQGSVNTIFSINGKKQTQDKTCVCLRLSIK